MNEKIAISVCIDYADYLAHTLPNNRPLFSAYYIVTERRDTETIKLAALHDCIVLYTDVAKVNGAAFNKSGMIHNAQKIIHRNHRLAWIVILDADIYLPRDLWTYINVSDFNKNGIYGISRKIYTTYADYVSDSPVSCDTCRTCVAGYFQMYWNKSKYYSSWSANCSSCDLHFMNLFKYVIGFKDIFCFHFGENCKNWNGRKVSEKWETKPGEKIFCSLEK
jgi:hypothetical protein